MMTSETVAAADFDSDLDEVEGGAERLPKLEAGDYLLDLNKVIRVDGDSGVYDVFEWTIKEAKGEAANPTGSKAKISFKRDSKGKDKEIADKKIFNCLRALNKGETPESRSAFLGSLRSEASGTVRAKVTFPNAVRSGKPYQKIDYFSV